MRYLYLVLLFVISLHIQGQGYLDVAEEFNIQVVNTGPSALGTGLSFYDYNHDGWDDLTFSTGNDSLIVYTNVNGTSFVRSEILPLSTDAKHPHWVDFDNDGDSDIMWTKRSGGTVMYRNDGNGVFSNMTSSLNIPNILGMHIYGQSWGDYDRDGYLDVFLATYNSNNGITDYLLHNNGNGTFSNVTVAAGVGGGTRATFQGVWHDFNFDGWLDLFVINDLGQGNEIYYNDQNGAFVNATASAQIAGNNLQSMSNSICDFDNDGDWDIYVTNIATGNALFVNNGNNVFIESAAIVGAGVNTWCWGANWVDYNHDRFEDLHVTTATTFVNQDFFLVNDGDGTFTNPAFPAFANDFSFTYATAKGDFDHDGYWDLIVSASGDSAYQLLQNQGGTNRWVKLSLEGTYSNRDAVGTYLQYYIDGQRYIKFTHSGENFLSQNSQHEILSLGTADMIDSLIITWPRGLVEKIYNIPSSSWLDLLEGANSNIGLSASPSTTLCGNQPVTLSAGAWNEYLWSTGEQTSSIVVTEPGVYTVQVWDAGGFSFTQSITIIQKDLPVYYVVQQSLDCWNVNDGYIIVESDGGANDSVAWLDGTSGSNRTGLAAGSYEFIITNTNNCSVQGVVEITSAPPITAQVSTTPATCDQFADGTVSIVPSGGTGSLNVIWAGINPNALEEDSYTVEVHDSNGCELAVNFSITAPPPIAANTDADDVLCFGGSDGNMVIVPSGGVPPLTIDWQGVNPLALDAGSYTAIITDANECQKIINYTIDEPSPLQINLTLTNPTCNGENDGSASVIVSGGAGSYSLDWNGINPKALSAGTYTIDVQDQNDCPASEVFVIEAPSAITATFELESAAVDLDGMAAIIPSGGTAPYTYWWSNNDTDSIINAPSDMYTCLVTDFNGCEQTFSVEIPYSSVDEFAEFLNVYPNPTHDQLIFDRKGLVGSFEIELYDIKGARIQTWSSPRSISLGNLSEGVYLLRGIFGDEVYQKRIVKE